MKSIRSLILGPLLLISLAAGLAACAHQKGPDQACQLPSSKCEDTYPGNNY